MGTNYRIQFTLLTCVENWRSPLLLLTHLLTSFGEKKSQWLQISFDPSFNMQFSP